jgi:DNA integrity scanning protein DisA with diadenylate cyclase activity
MKILTVVSKILSVIYMGVLGSAVYLGTPQLLTATLFLSWIWILSVGISFGVIYLAFKLGKPEDIVKIIEAFKTPSTLLKIFSIFWQAVVLVSLIYLGLVATAVVSFFVYIATWCRVYAFKVAQKQIAELKEQSEQSKPLNDSVLRFVENYNPDK